MREIINPNYKVIVKPIRRRDAMGMCCYDDRTIEIDPRQPKYERQDTVCHEGEHSWHPEYLEREVIAWTSERQLHLTPEEKEYCMSFFKRNICQRIGDAVTAAVWEYRDTWNTDDKAVSQEGCPK